LRETAGLEILTVACLQKMTSCLLIISRLRPESFLVSSNLIAIFHNQSKCFINEEGIGSPEITVRYKLQGEILNYMDEATEKSNQH
jgi:hypothetical protein